MGRRMEVGNDTGDTMGLRIGGNTMVEGEGGGSPFLTPSAA